MTARSTMGGFSGRGALHIEGVPDIIARDVADNIAATHLEVVGTPMSTNDMFDSYQDIKISAE